MTKKLYLNGLDCPSCAQKIEDRVSKLKNVEDVTINFATATLKLNIPKEREKSIIEEVQKITTQVESGVKVEEFEKSKPLTISNHHDHDHNHDHGDCHNHSHDDIGHSHEEVSGNAVKIQLVVGAVIAVLGIILGRVAAGIPEFVIPLIFAVAIIVVGRDVLKQGFSNLFKLEFEENFLMTIAVVAAFFIGEYMEAALVMILFVLGEYIESLAVAKSRRDISKLTNIRPDTANLILENGDAKTVMAEEIKIGDMILIKAGDRVPLDCEIIDGVSTIDNSAMTGESIPVNVAVGDKILSGAVNHSGLLRCRVVNSFENSAASRIVKLVEESVDKKGKTETFIRKFSRIYTPIIMVISAVFVFIPPLLGFGSFSLWLHRSLVFLVSSCPCAFVISVPLGMYSAIGANSKTGVLVKGGKYIEILSRANTVVLDKTGTLTTGKLGVEKIVSHSKEYTQEDILKLCALMEENSNHPIAQSIVKHYGKDTDTNLITTYKEIAGMGVEAEIENSIYLCGSDKMMRNAGIGTDKYDPSNIYLAKDGQIIGQIFVADQVKESSYKFVEQLKHLKIDRVVMFTGDSKSAAKSVAEMCDIKEYKFGLLPEDKVSEFEKIKSSGDTSIFVGDGINDAPVLAMADVGVSIGLGSDIAIESSDVVLMSGELKDLASAIDISRRSMFTIKGLIVLAMGIKFVVQILGIMGLLGAAAMGLAVFADVGVSIISIIIATRIMNYNKRVNY